MVFINICKFWCLVDCFNLIYWWFCDTWKSYYRYIEAMMNRNGLNWVLLYLTYINKLIELGEECIIVYFPFCFQNMEIGVKVTISLLKLDILCMHTTRLQYIQHQRLKAECRDQIAWVILAGVSFFRSLVFIFVEH